MYPIVDVLLGVVPIALSNKNEKKKIELKVFVLVEINEDFDHNIISYKRTKISRFLVQM